VTIKSNGPLPVRKDREARCPRCLSRITQSPTRPDTEYGHKRECPRRPQGIGWSKDPAYSEALDPLFIDSTRRECDNCGDEIDPTHHRVEINYSSRFRDLCQDCQSTVTSDRLFEPVKGGDA